MATMKPSNYWHPTPKFWRKVGDSILLATVAIEGLTTQLPISEDSMKWSLFFIGVVGVAGKFITNLFKDEE